MRAVIFKETGGPEKLIYTEVPTPIPKPGEALIRVRACALNHLDIWRRQGLPGVSLPLPHILGCDISGEVEQINGKSNVQKGARVIVSPGICCGRCAWCRSGWDSLCDQYKIIGFQIPGGYAEFVKIPIQNLIPVYKRYSWEEWASCPLVFLTVWHMLVTRAKLKNGETILIQAAGSGIGSAAIQIAKYLGAKVITTIGSDEKEIFAKKLGADFVINYQKTDFAKEARKCTGETGVDVVFEHIGGETFQKSLAALSKKGRLVTCGATSGPAAQIDLRFLYMRQHSIMGSYMGGHSELLEVIKLLEAGMVKPVVDTVFPLKNAQKAHERMIERKNRGKIILKPE